MTFMRKIYYSDRNLYVLYNWSKQMQVFYKRCDLQFLARFFPFLYLILFSNASFGRWIISQLNQTRKYFRENIWNIFHNPFQVYKLKLLKHHLLYFSFVSLMHIKNWKIEACPTNKQNSRRHVGTKGYWFDTVVSPVSKAWNPTSLSTYTGMAVCRNSSKGSQQHRQESIV